MTLDQYIELEREVFAAENAEEAIRLSGELLAKVDESLRIKINAHADSQSECKLLARACALHLYMLQGSGQMQQVYASALTAILMLDIADSAKHESGRLEEVFELTTEAIVAFSELTAEMPDDGFTQTHVPELYRLWGSRLYFYYQTCNKATVHLQPLVNSAHAILQQLIEHDAISWPEVEIQGQKVPVASNVVLADIIGRSIALGIFKQ